MTIIEKKCSQCQRKIEIKIGQTFIDGNLKWYSSYKCPFCTSTVEMDDFGFPPDEIRQKILIQEGEWNLIVDESKLKAKPKLLKILREALGLSIQEVSKFSKNFPNLISGTKIEMQWLKQLFLNEGIQSRVEKKSD